MTQTEASAAHASEVAALIETLHATEQRLALLTEGEVDTVTNRAGSTILLKDAQEQLRHSDAVKQAAILDSLPARIALLDLRGCIVSVNEAWRTINRCSALQDAGHEVGIDYIEHCNRVAGAEAELGRTVAAGMRDVLDGRLKSFVLEYDCVSAPEHATFQLTVTPLAETPPTGVVVMHLDITERMNAQRAVQRSAEMLRAIASGTPDTVFVKDAQGRYLLCNEAFARFVGRSVEEMLGQDNTSLFGATTALGLAEADRRVMESGELVSTEDLLVGAAGPRTFLVTKVPYRDAEGAVIGVIGISRDITERKRNEQGLIESRALLSMAGRLTQVGSWFVDLPATQIVWSDVLATMHGEAPGFSPTIAGALSYYAPEHRPAVRAAFEACLARGVAFDVESEVITAQGRRTWVRTIGEAVLGEDGHIRRVQGALQDLSERKQAEHATRVLASRLNDTLESITDGFITVDQDWRYTFSNNQGLRMLGRSRDELIGTVLWEAFPEALGTDFESGFRRGMAAAEGTSFEAFYAPWKAWVAVHCYPSQTGLSVYLRDVTQHRRDQDALRELNAELETRVASRTAELELSRRDAEQASRAKSAFLAAMSHEIRTPMNGVVGMIDVLEQSNLKSGQADIVKTVRESAYALLRIVDDVLDFSKIEAGRFQIDREPMTIEQVVERACDTLDHLSESKGVALRLFVDPAIPMRVLGDAARLRQVLLNLLGNAIKFSSAEGRTGAVEMRVTLASREGAVARVGFAVSDDGIGMDSQTLSRLFTPFTQADDSTTRRFGGTGLGLSISSRLAGLMGGGIDVTSQPGAGSRFCLTLPFDVLADEPVAARWSLRGVHCLVVGSPAGSAADLTAYLVHVGARVCQVRSIAAETAWFSEIPAGRHVVVLVMHGPARATGMARCQEARDAHPHLDLGIVSVNGERSSDPAGVVGLNGDALHRGEFLEAVALASGRLAFDDAGDVDANAGDEVDTMPATLSPSLAGEAGRLILVAEDNEINQRVIRKQLALLGFTAEIVATGTEALERARRSDYALLLTDLHMPRMDGYELALAIRADEAGGRRMPIVALTANALKGEARRCREAGMDECMTKPVRLADLHAMLQRWMPPHSKPIPLRKAVTVEAKGGMRLSVREREPLLPAADLRALAELVGSDPQVIAEMLSAFRTSAQRAAVAIRLGAQRGDAKAVGDAAHSLKSGARSIGAARLGAVCEALERATEAGRSTDLVPELARFELEFAHVARYLDDR